MRSIAFIAMMFCMALATLVVGGMNLYELVDFKLHGQVATMELADPTKKLVLPEGGYDVYPVDVRYVSPGKSVVVPQKLLDGRVARQLAAGGKVEVTYYTNHPKHVRYAHSEPDSPWGWLLVGAAASATFVYAWRLRGRPE